jgi:hypothetical protein
MKKFFAVLALVLLSACSTIGGNSAMTAGDQAFITGCETYNGLIVAMTNYYKDGKLNANDVKTVNSVRTVVYPICSGPIPSNVTQATTEILNGVAQLEALKTKMTESNPITATGTTK